MILMVIWFASEPRQLGSSSHIDEGAHQLRAKSPWADQRHIEQAHGPAKDPLGPSLSHIPQAQSFDTLVEK